MSGILYAKPPRCHFYTGGHTFLHPAKHRPLQTVLAEKTKARAHWKPSTMRRRMLWRRTCFGINGVCWRPLGPV